MMRTWHGFWNLSRSDRRRALEALLILAATQAGLRLGGYNSWKSLVSALPRRGKDQAQLSAGLTPDGAERIARIVESTARHLPFRPTCLEKSLGLWWMLNRRGFQAEIRIGGRLVGGRFQAHAWVERDGIVLNDAAGERISFSDFDNSLPVL